MRILAITCYAFDQSHVDMTDEMVTGLIPSFRKAGLDTSNWHISIFAQGILNAMPPRVLEGPLLPIGFEEVPENKGFAYGMNEALKNGADDYPDYEAVLCINNDILMPDKLWLKHLLDVYSEDRIMCPKTNFTGVDEQRASKPENKPHFDHGTTPAVCWLIPRKIVSSIVSHLKGRLFPDDLGGRAWGEDVYVSAFVRTKIAPRPFRIVPKSWIHHIGGQSSEQIPVPERLRAGGEARVRAKKQGFR